MMPGNASEAANPESERYTRSKECVTETSAGRTVSGRRRTFVIDDSPCTSLSSFSCHHVGEAV